MGEATREAGETAEADAQTIPSAPAPAPAPARTSKFTLRDGALIAEMVGAAAVVISLIFVGLQLSQANQLAREAAEQKQIESIGAISRILAENPNLAELMARGQAGGTLTPAEQVSLTSFLTYGQRTWEALYYQYRAGRVSPELWEAHRQQARAVQNTPQSRAVWQQRKTWFSKSYQEFRDSDGAGAHPGAWAYEIAPPISVQEPVAPEPNAPLSSKPAQ